MIWRLTLPYPPSANSLYRHRLMKGTVIKYKTHEHRDYMEAVGHALRVARLRDPTLDAFPLAKRERLIVTIDSYRPRRVGDIDNPIKALFDALTEHEVWTDDEQVIDLHVHRRDDKLNPRVEVTISIAPVDSLIDVPEGDVEQRRKGNT